MMIPIVVNFRRDGTFVMATGDRDPDQCDHDGECWSSDLVVRCSQCGVRLFAPPHVLAYKSSLVVEEMYQLWQAAGWPCLFVSWFGRLWVGDGWHLVQHPLFDHIDGLPVRHDKLAAFKRSQLAEK